MISYFFHYFPPIFGIGLVFMDIHPLRINIHLLRKVYSCGFVKCPPVSIRIAPNIDQSEAIIQIIINDIVLN